jgi:hypothetical protein
MDAAARAVYEVDGAATRLRPRRFGTGYRGDSFSLVFPVETLEEAQEELEAQWQATRLQPVSDDED